MRELVDRVSEGGKEIGMEVTDMDMREESRRKMEGKEKRVS